MNVICYCCDFSCADEFYHLFSSVTNIVYFAQPAKCEANMHYSGKRSQSSKKAYTRFVTLYIYCEHTSTATYAAYLSYCDHHGPTRDSLIPMCGEGLKSDH
jgi:hypothetical protein